MTSLQAQSELDAKLKQYIVDFRFQPVNKLPGMNQTLFKLGQSLFSNRILSTKSNISCMSCHDPVLGTGDGLPLSMGTGAHHQRKLKKIGSGAIIARNSPPLYNKGHKEFNKFFADMRVYFFDGIYQTPEPGLNGYDPEYREIVRALSGPLAAQALFPMIDPLEMLGHQNIKGNRYHWKKIRDRVMKVPQYRNAFKKLYPSIFPHEINIGHIATALAHFQKYAFQVTNTPWDNYLRGNLNALSESEKRGALVFIEQGRCARCHHGKHLTNFTMHNLAVPPIGPGKDGRGNDFGRYGVFKDERFWYRFMTPPLRNLAKTAPYFHNGSAATIRDIIEQYNDPYKQLAEYDGRKIIRKFGASYAGKLKVVRSVEKKRHIIERLSMPFRSPLGLTEEEKKLLEIFLTKSLSEK